MLSHSSNLWQDEVTRSRWQGILDGCLFICLDDTINLRFSSLVWGMWEGVFHVYWCFLTVLYHRNNMHEFCTWAQFPSKRCWVRNSDHFCFLRTTHNMKAEPAACSQRPTAEWEQCRAADVSSPLTCAHMHSHALTCTHMRLHALTCTYMHLHALTCTHMHLHALTCTHMHGSYVNKARETKITTLIEEWLHPLLR